MLVWTDEDYSPALRDRMVQILRSESGRTAWSI